MEIGSPKLKQHKFKGHQFNWVSYYTYNWTQVVTKHPNLFIQEEKRNIAAKWN